jgi:hypothetical protein
MKIVKVTLASLTTLMILSTVAPCFAHGERQVPEKYAFKEVPSKDKSHGGEPSR